MTTWTREPVDSHTEREIITGMIVSDRVVRHLALIYRPAYMTLPFTRTVAKWCLEFHQQYDRAPQGHIKDIYEFNRRNGLDPEQAAMIATFLASISADYEKQENFNVDFLLDQAEKYFLERALTGLKENLDNQIAAGNLLAAKEAVADFRVVDRSLGSGVEPLIDMDLIRDAFEDTDFLFQLPGDLGRLIGPFERETTWGITGAYKAGKTWLCKYISTQALFERLSVGWFSLEMPKKKSTRRLVQAICGAPDRPPRDDRDYYLLPVWDCARNQQGTCYRNDRVSQVSLLDSTGERPDFEDAPEDYHPCSVCMGRPDFLVDTWLEKITFDSVLTWRQAWKRAEALNRQIMGARFKFQFWPKYSAGIPEIKATLKVWEYLDGFVPDLIVVDSVDILKRRASGDQRHEINRNREELTALAQEQHALIITPIQKGSKDAVERATGRRTDVAEDSRILGHVDGMIVLNQTDQERLWHRARASVSVHRNEQSILSNEVIILQQLDLGQACLGSCFRPREKKKKEKKKRGDE